MKAFFSCMTLFFISLATCEPPVNNRYLPPQNGYNGNQRNGNMNHQQNGLTQAFLRSPSGPQRGYGPPSRNGPSGPSQNYGPPSQNYGAPQLLSQGPPPSQNYGHPSNQYLPPGQEGRSGYNRNGGEDYDEPANYNFEYMVEDEESGNHFGHKEMRQGDRAEGVYYVVLPDGRRQTVEYEADERGYRPRISYEDVGARINSNGYNNGRNNGYNYNNPNNGNNNESGPY